MKCRFVYDPEIDGNKVLIPYCWPVIGSNDIEDCTCGDFPETEYEFERERFNKSITKKNKEIFELKEENDFLSAENIRLNNILIRLSKK